MTDRHVAKKSSEKIVAKDCTDDDVARSSPHEMACVTCAAEAMAVDGKGDEVASPATPAPKDGVRGDSRR